MGSSRKGNVIDKSIDEIAISVLRGQFVSELTGAARTLRRRSEVVARLHGFTVASAAPLIQIGRFAEGLRLTRLAEIIDSDPVSLSRIIRNLEADGLVLREPDPEDGRAQILQLTEKGRAVADAAEVSVIEYRKQLLAGIDAADLEAALRVFVAMQENAPLVNLDNLQVDK
jgi:MarR family transcriptional regulator, transcriptional regulator for hemolysin